MKPSTIIALTVTGTLLGCVPELGPDSTSQQPAKPGALGDLTEDARDEMTQVFTVDSESFNTIEGEEGTLLYLWPNSLVDSDGLLVHGNVDVELIEIYGKGQMLTSNVPTNGLTSSGEIAQLVSGGEFYVNASQNGEDLSLTHPYQLIAPTENTDGPDIEMELFEIEEGPQGADAWVAVGDEPNEPDTDGNQGDRGNVEIVKADTDGGGTSTAYAFLSQEFGWSNIDRWYSDPRPKTTIHVEVPDGWDNDNCAVYLSYDGENTLARFDTYDAATKRFSEHYGLIPIGLEVHVIFMTESEGEWSYAIQETTIVDNHVTVFDNPDDFLETDNQGLIDAISALP
jgi:hypothetical protein